MLKRNFSFRNVAVLIICLAVSMMFASCNDDDNGNGNGNGNGGSKTKLSPPAWIQGSWGIEGYVIFKFTTNDVVVGGVSLKTTYVDYAGLTYSFKETKTNDLYEIKVTAKAAGETAAGTLSFKKGDGTYIKAATADDNNSINPEDYERFDKIN